MPVLLECGHWKAAKRQRMLGPHRNAGLELVYVRNGSAAWDYGGRVVRVESGQISFTWPWQWHGAANHVVPASEIFWLILPLEPRRGGKPRPRLHRSLGLMRGEAAGIVKILEGQREQVIPVSPLVGRIFPRVVESLRGSGNRLTFASRAHILAMLAELRLCAGSAPVNSPVSAKSAVRNFLQQLRNRLDENWTLEEMASACRMGRTHFGRWMKEMTGDSPVQYLNRQRVARARELLAAGRMSPTEAAFACGFQSSQYFATVFRMYTGLSPRDVCPRRKTGCG